MAEKDKGGPSQEGGAGRSTGSGGSGNKSGGGQSGEYAQRAVRIQQQTRPAVRDHGRRGRCLRDTGRDVVLRGIAYSEGQPSR